MSWLQSLLSGPRNHVSTGSEIRALTGLRGMASALVVMYHFWPSSSNSPVWFKWTIGRGYLWVDLFFILSGYVMMLSHGKLFRGGFSRAAFAGFLVRRVARIYPLYIVLLSAQIVYTVIAYGNFHQTGAWAAIAVDSPIRDIPVNVVLAQSVGVSPSAIGQAWSVSTEFAAYLCFPALVGLVMCNGRGVVAITAVVTVALLVMVAIIDMNDGAYHSGSLDAYDITQLTPLARCLSGFLLGMLTFRLSSITVVARIAGYDGVALATVILVVVMLIAGAPDLAIVALFPAVIMCLSRGLGVTTTMFGNPLMHQLGVLSYAVYLLHPLLQRPRELIAYDLTAYLPDEWAFLLSQSIGTGVLLALAGAAYNFVELPGRRAVQAIAARTVLRGIS
jgi:peptidoglycan/LPS O-acetylase OafA/YrhL